MPTLPELQQERESLGGQLLRSLFQIIILLLAPVFLAVLLGNYLNDKFLTGSLVTFLLAVAAMALSWIPIWKIYKRVDTRMVELDTLIKEEKQKIEK
jgi:undecaprenyl pyrophosphate phosphatase UppP